MNAKRKLGLRGNLNPELHIYYNAVSCLKEFIVGYGLKSKDCDLLTFERVGALAYF